MSNMDIVTGVSRLTAEQVAARCDTAADGLEADHADFQNPPFPPAALRQIAVKIRADIKAQTAAETAQHQATAALKTDKKDGRDALTQTMHYAAIAAKGDEQKIKALGMDLKGKPVHAHDLPQPTNVSVELGHEPHQVLVHFHGGGRRATEHHVETTTDPGKPDSWALAASGSHSPIAVGNLAPGAHSFRVVAVGAEIVSPPSGIVTIYVP